MKAVVVASGEPDARDAAHLANADLVVAADGGGRWLAAIGVRPDVLLGDLDSVEPAVVEQLADDGVTVERHPTEKGASDAELALGRAVASGADEVIVLGALGGQRLDHELANLLMLADPGWRGAVRDLRIVRGGTVARALHGGERLSLAGTVGDLVTLLPIGGRAEGIRTDGLRYALDGEALDFGRSRGLSNEVIGTPASVWLERGTLLVIEMASEGGDS
ncbi:MAG TPA: thiamine diphosphokinase [Candidatus Dormibacteraeota bacterium]|nr:thiamine diphosphokinase [Candidatus Dormibacteraeota bacterium]